jgi:hypothetical protein
MPQTESSQYILIAPCGMNCGLCLAFLREKNRCPGCNIDAGNKSKSCLQCVIKNCALLAETTSNFCYDCPAFPCTRLKQLDKRYRTKYKMSMIENLGNIKNSGLESLILSEKKKWNCPTCGGTICVHRGYCLDCKDSVERISK